MAEGFVGLRHLVSFVAPLDSGANVVCGVSQLAGQFLSHSVPGARTREANEPAHGQRHLALALDLDGHLIGGAADAPGLDLDLRRCIAQGSLERLDRRALGRGLDHVHAVVEDALRHGLLAARHQFVDEAADSARMEFGIRWNRPPFYLGSPWHCLVSTPLLNTNTPSRSPECSLRQPVLDWETGSPRPLGGGPG